MEAELKKRKATQIEQNVCSYLNDLRESGDVNMFGASGHVELEFGLNKKEAKRMLSLWMKNFNDGNDYKYVND